MSDPPRGPRLFLAPVVVVAVVVLASVTLGVAPPPVAAQSAPSGPSHESAGQSTSRSWRQLLQRAAQEAVSSAYEGELLWVTWSLGEPSVETLDVRHTTGELQVHTGSRTLSLSRDGGTVTDHEEGWHSTLPATTLGAFEEGLALIERKYTVEVVGTDELLDRSCDILDVRLRADSALRERLWLDRQSGLLLRRQTYGRDGSLVRMVVYLSLDLSPMAVAAGTPSNGHGIDGSPVPLLQAAPEVVAVDDEGLATLRRAGWTVPELLPGGYHAVEAYAMSAGRSQPLQVVYRDGLYSVSLYQQRGHLDWDSLPPGGQRAEGLGFRAMEWPRAVPERMVWEADGTTWSAVGDAPPEDLQRIVRALPGGESQSPWARVRRGLGRLWSWVSPWD